jgi:dienelactone hydrolase
MQVFGAVVVALLALAIGGSAQAVERQQVSIQTSSGGIPVDVFASRQSGPRPAVIILSGSRGFSSSAYDEIGEALNASGLDAYLVHILSPVDLDTIANAGSASARIRYYAKRLPDWIEAVGGAALYLGAQPDHAGKVGVLGISLGAQIAAAATVERADIGALVLVDGGFPNGYARPISSLPPLHLIWGSADQTFPVSIGKELVRLAQHLGTAANMDIYDGGTHDFFLKPGTGQAKAAHQSAATFLASQLLNQPVP